MGNGTKLKLKSGKEVILDFSTHSYFEFCFGELIVYLNCKLLDQEGEMFTVRRITKDFVVLENKDSCFYQIPQEELLDYKRVDPLLSELYRKANEIEVQSQSPRLRELQSQKNYCQIGLGTYYPETTKYMLVSLNPGGGYILDKQYEPEISVKDHKPLERYLSTYKFTFSRNLNKIITAFAEEKKINWFEAVLQFGITDCSFFHSQTSGELQESFLIETKECLPILWEELSLKYLDTIIFSGKEKTKEFFFYNLYKVGSPIQLVYKNEEKHSGIKIFRTTLLNEREYNVCFITHISATRGLTEESLNLIGKQLAQNLR